MKAIVMVPEAALEEASLEPPAKTGAAMKAAITKAKSKTFFIDFSLLVSF
jgi:hypothetical protein